jgi:hypothetical protein
LEQMTFSATSFGAYFLIDSLSGSIKVRVSMEAQHPSSRHPLILCLLYIRSGPLSSYRFNAALCRLQGKLFLMSVQTRSGRHYYRRSSSNFQGQVVRAQNRVTGPALVEFLSSLLGWGSTVMVGIEAIPALHDRSLH